MDINGIVESIYAQFSIISDLNARYNPNLSPNSKPKYNVANNGTVPNTINL